MKRFLCRVLDHKLSNGFTQPEQRFEMRWHKWLDEAVPFEVFFHDCDRCGDSFKVWRWTRAAMMHGVETGVFGG